VRVPLGWTAGASMVNNANPQEKSVLQIKNSKQTVEIRSGDCTAELYLYMAALIVAAQHGLEMPNALEMAENLYVNVNIHKAEHAEKLKSLKGLPIDCADSAKRLDAKRKYFEKNGIFSKELIDNTIKTLNI
jgi:glutamine synthetase